MTATSTLSGRDRAILGAVAAGGAEHQMGTEADPFLDGHCCYDQSAAHQLVPAGLIAAVTLGSVGQRVAALIPAGREACVAKIHRDEPLVMSSDRRNATSA